MSLCRHCLKPLEFDKSLCRWCGGWTSTATGAIGSVSKAKTTTLDLVAAEAIARAAVGDPWDACFGGGIVWSSCTLFGGAPGAGKTTALLQILSKLADLTGKRGYYLSAEQGPGDLRIVADRLRIPNMDRFRVLTEFGVGAEIDEALFKEDPPAGIVVDSVSALVGKDAHGAIAIARCFKKYSIKWKAPSFLICHMTKEGDMAGLLGLQHEVDTLVTFFMGIRDDVRHLKAWKNRYGSTSAEYNLLMTQDGLISAPTKKDKLALKLERMKAAQKLEPEPVPVRTQPEPEPEPRVKAEKKLAPDVIEVDGQRLVRKKKDRSVTPSGPASKAAKAEGTKSKKPKKTKQTKKTGKPEKKKKRKVAARV